MKPILTVLISSAFLIFSGCYTQLLVEDPQPVQQTQQVITAAPAEAYPLMPGTPSNEVLVVAPAPVYVPVYSPAPISGNSSPAGSGQQSSTVQRTSGEQRSAPAASPSASQNNSRNTEATRSGNR